MQKLLGLLSGADSKTVARVEQYQDVRTTIKSVEITVEKAEMIKVHIIKVSSSLMIAEHSDNGDFAENTPSFSNRIRDYE